MSSLPYLTEQTTLFQTKRTKLKKNIHILAALQQNSYPKEFIQRTVKNTTEGKNWHERAQKKNLSKPKVSTYLTSKESVSSSKERLISTRSKQHSTPRNPSEVRYQNQMTPYQRKTGTMLYTN